jgi:predicted metal-dependent enzyme (double-stranded beta helix superfamily)
MKGVKMADQLIKNAIERSLIEARQAIDEHGVSDTAMQAIQKALGKLASTPGLGEAASLQELHRSGAAASVLASEGADGITLVYGRFPPDQPTPVHDHGSWGVAYVLAGQDRYIHWKRLDDGSDLRQATLEVEYDRILEPGDSVYWFDPPRDIHSQQGHGGETAWELVMFGHDPMQVDRHYFDVDSGEVIAAEPQ